MKVRLKEDINRDKLNKYLINEYVGFYFIQKNKIYTVLDYGANSFRLINEQGDFADFSVLFFDIIDNSINENWVISFSQYNENRPEETEVLTYMKPIELENFSYEDLYNEKSESVNTFLRYISKYNIQMVANLAYAPKHHKEYYDNFLEKIDKKIKLKLH